MRIDIAWRERMRRVSAIIGLAAVLVLAGQCMAVMTDPVRTETGLLSGIPGRDPSITVFKGVPFAAPPVGDLRFRPPPIPWQGVRKADQFGKICPQNGPKDTMSEDCLFANVWTGATSGTERRPVFVWIYGGGFTIIGRLSHRAVTRRCLSMHSNYKQIRSL